MALIVTSAQAVTVDIYSGHSTVGGGTPYSGLVDSFTSPDIMFATNYGYYWFPRGGDLDFGAEFTGCLDVADDGSYIFGLDSDDGSMLYIDGGLVIDNGGGHPPLLIWSAPTFLTAGEHSFRVEFFEDFGGKSGVDLLLPDGVTYTPCTVEVDVDIKGGSCPNPFNPKSKGSVPVAIVGSEDYDVNDIDPDSLVLTVELPGGGSVNAIPGQWILEDSTEPPTGDPTDCDDCFDADDPANFNCDLIDASVIPAQPGTDGILDSYCGDGEDELVVKFDTQELATALAAGGAAKGDCVVLTLTGETLDGESIIVGSDSMLMTKTP
jgi:hypothetical protein